MDIKDYLHLYLGCEVEIEQRYTGGPNTTRKATFLGFTDARRTAARTGFRAGPEGVVGLGLNVLKPILRPLSDMTKEEAEEYGMMYEGGEYNPYALEFDCKIGLGHYYTETDNAAERIRILLSKHFDLFGLIEAGLAIDKTTLGRLVNQ